ncbi:MAG: hypothetical protein ACI86H_002718 [bacterium]|jgi:hypothetical protein
MSKKSLQEFRDEIVAIYGSTDAEITQSIISILDKTIRSEYATKDQLQSFMEQFRTRTRMPVMEIINKLFIYLKEINPELA